MGEIRLQMIDSHISSHWWQELVKYFVNVGNSLEIRCWKEESEEIQQALQYGNLTEANYEVSIKGIVTKEFLTFVLELDLSLMDFMKNVSKPTKKFLW